MRGHVARRGSSWGYVIDVAPDPATGKRRQRTKSGFATKAAAEDAMRKAIAIGSSAGGDAQKLADYLDEWLTAVEPRLRGTTASSYRIAVDRIKAGLGAVKLRDLTPLMIERFYADLVREGGKSGDGLSAKTVRNTHVVLRKALADGERLELLVRNPAARAKPPTGERKETPTWTAAQVTTFLSGVEDDPLYALWVLLATTGLRRGEALGLRWSDVDLDRATLSVSQTITTVDNQIAVTPPKSDRSRRRIGLDPDTVRVLRDHQRDQERDRKLLGTASATLVFAEPDGGPVHPDTVTRRFKRLVRRSGLPPLRGPHDLRHTWASLALAAGVHPKVVSDRLGHSTIAITIDTYSHAIPSLDAEAASTVAAQLFRR
ncbi:MAG: tyrosine-type recombinase/integrase [Microthrixaceae bacterium]